MITKLFISDIHFGTARNTDINKSLTGVFEDNPSFCELDYIIISGDLTEKQLSLDSDDTLSLLDWVLNLFNYAVAHSIKVRFLKGTVSHEREQMKVFDIISRISLPNLDFLYLDDIVVVRETDHTCLYVPDEIRETTAITYQDCLLELAKHNLDKVDSCVIHGPFKFSLGYGTEDILHVEEQILDMVIGYIVAGHIHGHLVYDRIIIPGSADRLRFGEEEDKGFIVTRESISNPEQNTFEFVVNRHAKIFKYVKVKSENTNDLKDEVLSVVRGHPDDSYFKLIFEDDNPLQYMRSFDTLPTIYNFSHAVKSDVVPVVKSVISLLARTHSSLSEKVILEIITDKLGNDPLKEEKMKLFNGCI